MCLGIPGQVVAIEDADKQLGVVAVAGVRRVTNLSLVCADGEALDSLIGVWVLIHVGFAMARIDEQEAARTLALLRELGDLNPAADGGDLA
jgi:hydrogenase expression/formation protein HypC